MSFSKQVSDVLWDTAKRYSSCTGICPCSKFVTVLISDHSMISMSPGYVRILGNVCQSGWSVRDQFKGSPFLKPCAHDFAQKVEIRLTMSQWSHVVSRIDRFVIVQGCVTHGMTPMIDAASNHSGIIADPTCRIPHEPNSLHFAELFSGGFSGWSQVTHFLDTHGHRIEQRAAVDIDPECQSNYVHTYGVSHVFGPGSFECTDDELPSRSFIQADVRHHGWLHLLGCLELDCLVASPPCPAWSSANQAAGLHRRDGQLTAECFGILGVVGPKCMGFEMVSGIQQHTHWRFLVDLLYFFGFEIRWMKCADLAAQLPHRRQRLLMVAIRNDCKLNPHLCTMWREGETPTLESHGILMKIYDPWKNVVFPSACVLAKYLHELMMPRDRTSSEPPFKKPRSHSLNRRVKFGHEAVDCVMASYGHGHELPEANLLNYGLYGSLIYHEDQIRFLQPSEVVALFGAVTGFDTTFDIKTTFHQLGNAIAVPHAAIVVCNMLAFFDSQLGSGDVQDLFQEIMNARLHCGNMKLEMTDRGFRFSRDEDTIPPTVPFHEFCQVVIHDRDNRIPLIVERKIDLWAALTLLFGDVSKTVAHAVCQGFSGARIPLTRPFPVFDSVHITMDAPAILLVSDQIIRKSAMGTPCSLVLTQSGPAVLHMGPTIDRVLEILSEVKDETLGIATDFLGSPLNASTIAPYFFMEFPEGFSSGEITALEMVEFKVVGSAVSIFGSAVAIHDLRTFLRTSRCDDFLLRFGWQFVVPISCNDLIQPESLLMIRCPGMCAISTDDVIRALVTFTFLLQIKGHSQVGASPQVPCRFRLFNDWVWTGNFGINLDMQFFDHAWNRACRIFAKDLPLRYIVQGKQIPIDVPLNQLVDQAFLDGREIRIHTVLRLTGGGPITLRPNDNPSSQELHEAARQDSSSSRDAQDLFYLDRHYFEDAIQVAVSQWRVLPGQKDNMKTSDYLSMNCTVQDGVLIWTDDFDILLRFAKDVKENAIELMLDRMGWMMALQFVAWENPIVARLLMFPRPEGRVVSLGLVRFFLQKVLLRYAMPYDSEHNEDTQALVRVHAAGSSLAQFAVHRSIMVSEFTDSWEHSCQVVGLPAEIRILICGKQASKEFRLSDYAKIDANGQMHAHIHYVVPLRGGGPSQQMPQNTTPSSAKNHLAAFLLEQGADIGEISKFIQSLAKTGPMAMASVLAPKDHGQKLQAIRQLASSMNVEMPQINVKDKFLKRKIHQHVQSTDSLDVSQLCIQKGFFRNEDDTPALQRECPAPGESGISLVTPKIAQSWMNNVLSADEQMMLVIGPCPAEDSKCCQKIHVPMFFKNEPLIVDCCAHQLGQKTIKVKECAAKDIPISQSCVFSVTVYKDEVSQAVWESVIESPVKTSLGLLFQDAEPPALVCPPWGRTFHDMHGKPNKHDPFSFQVHIRIPAGESTRMLRASGKRGAYTVPKSEDKKISSEYQIVWVTLDSIQLALQANAQAKALGIVRSGRNPQKISKGIRFLRADFIAGFQALRPQDPIPKQIPCRFLFKVSPTPPGATMTEVQTWIDSNNWVARPIRSLSNNTWLCGCEKAFDEVFSSWNDHTILIKWLEPKKQQNS